MRTWEEMKRLLIGWPGKWLPTDASSVNIYLVPISHDTEPLVISHFALGTNLCFLLVAQLPGWVAFSVPWIIYCGQWPQPNGLSPRQAQLTDHKLSLVLIPLGHPGQGFTPQRERDLVFGQVDQMLLSLHKQSLCRESQKHPQVGHSCPFWSQLPNQLFSWLIRSMKALGIEDTSLDQSNLILSFWTGELDKQMNA